MLFMVYNFTFISFMDPLDQACQTQNTLRAAKVVFWSQKSCLRATAKKIIDLVYVSKAF